MKKTVYLAGPISGQRYSSANDWRYQADLVLKEHDLIGISPLRCEPIHGDVYGTVYDADPKFGTARAISSKNLFDVQSCDMTLAFFPKSARLETGHLSYGTLIELGWANCLRKPTVLVSDDPEVINHPVIQATAGWVLPTLEDGLDVIVGILGGYVGGKNV